MAHVSTIPGGGYPNLPACLREAAARTDRGITFIERAGEEETLSYRQLLDLALGTLVRLRENGVAAGHELVIQVERNRDFVVLYWACLLGKIVAVPLSPGTQEDHRIKLLKVWNKLNCPTLVCDPAQLDRIKKFGAEAGHEAACAAIAGRCLFPDLIGPAATPPLLPEVDPGDIAFIQFSSGSTGDPKGVVLTHRNLVANVSDIISRSEITPHDSLLSWMPLTHDMGLICFHLTGVVAGVAQALLPTALFVKRPLLWLHKASTHGATLLYSPNFGLQYALAALPPQTNLGWDLSRVRLIYNGAEPISYALCGRFAQALAPYGLPQGVIFPGYGMAEASVAVTLPPVGTPLTPCHAHRHFLKVGDPVRELPDADQPEAVTFVEVGRPVAQCAVRIAGDADESLPPRTVGHIQIRGANVTAGYYNDPRESARVCTPDGWVRTGDLGFLRDGRLVITGRQKDIIIANGQNYYPHDIERSVYTRPELALELGKVAACGVRNPGTSRDDLVIFVLHKGSPEAFAPLVPGIREAVAAGIGLSVEAVVPVRRLPKTTSGKVQYFKLREQFGNGAFDELVTRLRQLAAPASGNDPIDGALTDRLLSLWHRTFPGTPLAENDNFFAGGLSSLQLTQFAAAVCTHTGRAVPLSCLFEHPSIGQLAAALAGGHEAAPGTIPRLAPAADYGVSPVQKRFWLLSEYEQEQVPLNLAVAYRLRGTLCVPSLLKALTALVHRHESLRTTYVNRDGEIRQRIAAPGAEGFAPRYVEASDAPNAPERALAEAECDANRRFDLATGPLLRATLTKTGPRDYLLALVMHHIAVDGWSITRMLDELAGSYRSLRAGEADLLPPLSMGPKDYTAWLAGASEATGTAGGRYWADALPAAPGRLPLPTYRPRPALKTYRGASLQFAVDPATAAGMGRVSRTHASSLFVTLTAALNVLLYKYTGQTDLVIGTTTAGRERPEVQALVGLLIHTLPVRTRIAAGGSFTDLQRAVKAYMAGAYAHEGHPFEQFLTEWQPQADPGRSPLFDVLLVLQDFDDPFARLAEDLSAERVEVPVHSGLVDLEFTFVRAAGALSFRIRYDRDLFTPEQVERMGGHLCRLMAEIAADPAAPVGRLRMLTAAEEAQLDGFNPLPVAYPARTVVELFEAQAASTPDAVAVLCAGRTLTYRQLNEAANRQAHLLRRDFLPQPDDCFAVMLPPGEDRVVALLAILKAGAAYLPIDPEWPALRTQHVLADRRPRLLYTQGAAAEAALAGLPLLRVEDLPRQAAGLPATNPGVPIAPGQLAYCLYTSGSTGTPKGIHVEHGALADYVQTFADYFEVAATDAVLQQASLAFDTSVEEIYPVLCRGGRLVVLPGGARDVDALRDHLAAERVTLLSTTPLVIEQLNRHGELPAGLRVLISGGDELRPAYLTRLLGKTAIYNTYGPTESTVCALYHRVETLADAPLLGRPIANRRVYVLDGDLQRVPVGVSGQICLAGRGLARGYVQAHLDAGRFVADPFAAGERMYLTGDRGKWLPDGRIAFEGRLDHQLKINGYRVEPGEIEQVLLTHPAVAQAIVTGHYTAGGTPFLAVHYRSHAPLTPADLRRFLAGRLPAYMVPGQYVALAQFPLLPGGKVDRGQLRLPATAAPATGYTPRTGVESRLAAIWTELLGGERVDPEGSFFLLGGNSLKATQLINQVYAALGVRLTLKAIFETPVFADLAARLAQERSSAYPAIRPVGRKKHYPLSWAQQQLWLLLQTIPDPAVYNISGAYRLSGRLHREALEDAFRAVVARHAALRTTFVTIDGTPRQRVHDPAGYPFRVEYRDVRTTADPAGEAERIFGKLARRRFDPQGGPLFAATLVRTGASEHVLVFCIHHIVADGWSLQVLLREFVALYSARVTGGADPLPDAPRLQYPDYAAWQRHYLSPARLRRHQAYWLSRLAGPLPILDLPARWPRPVAPPGRPFVPGRRRARGH